MTVETGADSPDTVEEQPQASWSFWSPPAAAVGAWVELQRQALDVMGGPPCARDPESWWAGRSTRDAPLVEAALQGCRWCPVREACAEYALAAEEPAGVWGGLTVDDRAALLGEGRAS